MHYTDAPDAQQQLQQFIALCRQHAIPCDSFQLSSGYTSINNKRYVFNWNYDKVPQPKQLSGRFTTPVSGWRLTSSRACCRITRSIRRWRRRGCLSAIRKATHPSVPASGMTRIAPRLHQPGGGALVAAGRHAAAAGDGHRLDRNDNNEYEVWDGEARCHGFGRPIAIKHIRPVMPLLMMRASMEAQQRFAPQKRPYLISRSGCAGMQRCRPGRRQPHQLADAALQHPYGAGHEPVRAV